MDKKQRKAYQKAWYNANKDKVKAVNKIWRGANTEKLKAYKKAYCQINADKIKVYDKAYREANRERYKAWHDAYHQANFEKVKAWNKAYWKANSEQNRKYRQKRRALKQKAPYEVINEKTVFMRDGWICQICKNRVNKRFKWPNPMCASLDHIVPLTQGGSHTYKNVQLTHLTCNLTKNVNVLPQGEQMRIF